MRNPNIEIRENVQIFKIQLTKTLFRNSIFVLNIRIFGFRICFVFRASDF